MLRDYQVEIVNKFLETPHCLQEIATGAGKTLVTASLSQRAEKYGKYCNCSKQRFGKTDC